MNSIESCMLSSLGFGRWSKNILFSFIEDTIFPFPFCQKNDENSVVTNKSWRRRVDVNMMFYMILLLFLTTMNIIYTSQGGGKKGIQHLRVSRFTLGYFQGCPLPWLCSIRCCVNVLKSLRSDLFLRL